MPCLRTVAALMALTLMTATVARSQPSTRRPAFHVTRAATPPLVDGELDDVVWRSARFVSDFRQQEPVENGVPSVRTEVAFAYDDDALYVGARMFVQRPGDVQAVATRHDDTGKAERLIVSLDTFNDRRTAYSFAVTAAGVRADWFHRDDSSRDRDSSFDPIWEARVTHLPDRWIAEMRIPFSQLRFRPAEEQNWGVNVNRYIAHRNEDLFWIVVPKGVTAWSSYFGELRGIRALPAPLRIELMPYIAADHALTSRELVEPGDPFLEERRSNARVGLDAKFGLGPNLTLDTTVHPDFGQVEADPAVVNLTAFETSFEERRPFFIEGNQMLKGRGPTYYYSRRIGGAPRGKLDTDFVDRPLSTPILGAVKLTGRLPSRLSIGALSALTERVYADTFDSESQSFGRALIEPLTSYNLLRVEQEFGKSSSKVGATVTGVYRDFSRDSLAARQFHRWATTGGLDWNLRLDDAKYELTGGVGFSAVGGEEAAILELQRSSAHYFQRPDQDHVELDESRRSLVGWMSELGVGKRSGALTYSVGGYAESPGFELNDLGLFPAGDDLGTKAAVSYRDTARGAWLHSWEIGADALEEWNFGGVRAPASLNLLGSVTLLNFWTINGKLGGRTPGLDDALTRGGPLIELGSAHVGGLGLSSSYGSRTPWGLTLDWELSQTGPSGVVYGASLGAQPLDWLMLSVNPRYLHKTDNRQYIDTVEDAGGRTFGNRYLFATVDRRELALQARLQVALSPDLVAEAYAEPFSSSGAFRDFGELSAPGARPLRRYGTQGTTIEEQNGTYTIVDGASSFEVENPNFTALSLRSTVVVRWEFLPGSALFAVWQQERSDELLFADARGRVSRVFTAPSRHVLAMKLVYWWAR